MGERVQRSVFASHDRLEAFAALEEVYAVRGAHPAGDEEFSMRLAAVGMKPLTVERVRWQGAPAGGVGEHPGVLRVGQVLGGAVSMTAGRDVLPSRGPFLLPQRPYTTQWEELDVLSVTLDAAVVEDHARARMDSETFRLEFTGAAPVTAARARYWQATVAHLSRDVLPHDEVMSSRLMRDQVVRSVITALLYTFPNTSSTPVREPAQSHPTPAAIRRAIAFMDEHLDEPIGLPEIAAAARISPRGLQAAFRREQGTTPLEYLRTARMEAAHAELLAADPATGVTVTAIAAHWGFAHPGRFATAYRARYGRMPSATLRE